MKDDKIYLAHILDAIRDVEEMTMGMDEQAFLKDKAVRLAVVKSLEIIGEASRNVSKEFREKNPAVPWSDIIKMRDKTVHSYFGISYPMVWEVVGRDLPELKKLISAAGK